MIKAQSAMEYLMTYGWAILIVAVVLGALYSLGIFNGANFLGGTCVAGPGYLCSNPLLDSSGVLAFTFGYQGPNVTVVGFACTTSSSAPSSFVASGSSDLQPGQQETVDVTCPVSSSTIGSQFSGYLWVEYDQAGQSDLIAKMAAITTSVSVLTNGVGTAYVISGTNTIYAIAESSGDILYTATMPSYDGVGGLAFESGNLWGGSNGYLGLFDTSTKTGINYYVNGGSCASESFITLSPGGSSLYASGYDTCSGHEDLLTMSTNPVNGNLDVSNMIVFPTSSGTYMALNPDGSTLYVSCLTSSCSGQSGANQIAVVSTATHAVSYINLPSTLQAQGIAVTPDGKYLYVVDFNNHLYKVDLSDNQVVNTLSTQLVANCGSTSAIAMNPNGDYVYVWYFCGSNGYILPVSISNNQPQNYIGGLTECFLGGGQGPLTVSTDGSRIIASNACGGTTVSIISASSGAYIANVVVPSPGPVVSS